MATYQPAATSSPRISADIIDPDDLTLDDLDHDDPLSHTNSNLPTSSSPPLSRQSLLSNFPGQTRDVTAPHSTIDETVWATLSRDITAVYHKLLAVLWPRYSWRKWPDAQDLVEGGFHNGQRAAFGSGGGLGAQVEDKVVREWDLWGPLLFALSLSVLLSLAAEREQRTEVFAGVFALVWGGEAVVTVQIRLLGGNISFFQSVSIIGYTLFPLVVCALLSALGVWGVVRVPVYAVCFLWSLAAGVSILGGSGVVRGRVALAVFPLALFYFALVCLCLVS